MKLCWLNSEDYSAKNFECSEINVTGLPYKKWIILPSKCSYGYEYSDDTQKVFISIERIVSSD